MKRTTEQIRRAARNAGSHFFERDTASHWGTVTTEHTYDAGAAGTVLLISDQQEGTAQRRYRPILSLPDGTIRTLMIIGVGPCESREGRSIASMAAHWLSKGMSADGVADRLAVDYPWIQPTLNERN